MTQTSEPKSAEDRFEAATAFEIDDADIAKDRAALGVWSACRDKALLSTATPEATGSPTSANTGLGGGPPSEATLGRSCRQRSVRVSGLMATTRPPVGGTPLSAGRSCEPSRMASIPLV